MNEEDFSGKLRYFINFCGSKKLHLPNSEGVMVKTYIRQAPEPEDIIWNNLGRTSCELIKKKLMTYIVTLIILGISFAVVYGLSVAQVRFSDEENKNTNRQYLSFIISLVIAIFNVIIQRKY